MLCSRSSDSPYIKNVITSEPIMTEKNIRKYLIYTNFPKIKQKEYACTVFF